MRMFNVTEQRLVDRKNNILKRKWLSDLELEEIQRNIEDIGNGEVELESDVDEGLFLGFDREGHDVFMKVSEVALENCMVPNVVEERSNVFVIKMNIQITNEDMTILEKMRNVLSKETRERLPPLRGVEKHRILEATRNIDEIMNKIEVGNITELNDLVYAGAVVVTKMLGVKNRKGTGMEPWWKRRMEAQVKQLNKDLGHINTLIERKNIKKKHEDGLKRRYKLKRRGLPVTREEIKERIMAKNNKIKIHQSRINHYQQNCTFKNNQGKFYRKLNSGGKNYETTEVPDKKEAQEFWGNIRGERKEHRKDAEWLKNFKRDFEHKDEQEELEITPEKIKKILRKMPNWKAPGPFCGQGFWLKKFKSILEGLRRNFQKRLENGNVPMWMTKGRTILMQIDIEKGKAASNYRPITCLSLVWKLLTGVIVEEVYGFLDTNLLLPQEQKECRRKSRGTSDLLFIDQMIMGEVKMRKRNLSMAWINCKKA